MWRSRRTALADHTQEFSKSGEVGGRLRQVSVWGDEERPQAEVQESRPTRVRVHDHIAWHNRAVNEPASVRLFGQSDERAQSFDRVVRLEPTGPNSIEDWNTLTEFGQHRRAAVCIDPCIERTNDISGPPGRERRDEAMKASEKPGGRRLAPDLQPEEARRIFISNEKNRSRRRLAQGQLNREPVQTDPRTLWYQKGLFQQAGRAMSRARRRGMMGAAHDESLDRHCANQRPNLIIDILWRRDRFFHLEPQNRAKPLSKPMHGDLDGPFSHADCGGDRLVRGQIS